ncbi:MAG TPA: hypothetical protein VJM12_05430 [Pyrinomonadaceae bacterium]|nr:hypothetical protein [Pyrinomonadaceae bacterium]
MTAILAIVCLIGNVYFLFNVKIDRGIAPLAFNEITAKSIDARLILAQSVFQVALLMLGALWGLVIAKKNEIQILFREEIETVMFLSASVVLLMSVVSYGIYLSKISSQFAITVRLLDNSPEPLPLSIPDVFDQNIDYLFTLQWTSLVAGIVNGVVTLFSAHKLRGETQRREIQESGAHEAEVHEEEIQGGAIP